MALTFYPFPTCPILECVSRRGRRDRRRPASWRWASTGSLRAERLRWGSSREDSSSPKRRARKNNTRHVSSVIHSARPTVSPVATIIICCFVLLDLKSGDGRAYGRTTCAKIMITTGRDCGSAEWINKSTVFKVTHQARRQSRALLCFGADAITKPKELLTPPWPGWSKMIHLACLTMNLCFVVTLVQPTVTTNRDHYIYKYCL